MARSRRELLKAAMGGSLLFFAGCSSNGIEYRIEEETGGTTRATRSETPGGTGTPSGGNERLETPAPDEAEPRAEDPPVENPRLAADTDRVFDEIEWFATTYPAVLNRALSQAKSVHQTLVGLQDSPELSARDIERIKRQTGTYHDLLRAKFEPHFPTSTVRDIIQQSGMYVSNVERYAERGDIDEVEKELSKFTSYYRTLSSRDDLQEEFPDLPIHARLANYITLDSYSQSTPLVFVVSYPDENYRTVVRADESWDVRTKVTSKMTSRDLQRYDEKQAALFNGVHSATGRTGRLFFNVHLERKGIRHVPVYLQRYEDPRTARNAYASLLDSSVFVEETVRIGRTEWHRGYYFQALNFEYRPIRDKYLVYDDDGTVLYEKERASKRQGRQLAVKSGYVLLDNRGNVVYDGDGKIDQLQVDAGNPDEEDDIVYTYLTRIGQYILAAHPTLTPWEQQSGRELDPLRETWLS